LDREGIKHLAGLMDASILSAPLSAKWMNIQCPFAPWTHEHGTDNTPSFGVEIKKNAVSRFWCFSCQRGAGSLGELLMELKALGCAINFKELNVLADAEWDGSDLPSFDDEEDIGSLLFQFPEDWLESFPLAVNSGPALVYMAGRDFPKSVMSLLDLRYDPLEKRVCFPIRGEDGKLYGLHGRKIVENGEKHPYFAYGYKKRRNPHVLLGEHQIDWNLPVVLAEGPMDYARTKQVYRNVLSPLHASLSEYMLERLEPAFEIVTLFDPDKAGDAGRRKIRKWAGKKRIVNHAYLPDDKDAAELTPEQVGLLLQEFVSLDPLLK
jgi:hypothetical protein